ICTVRGSAPREAGAKMLVWAEGQDGTIGGGSLEFTVVEQARRMLEAGVPWRFQNYPLGPLLGQCCGGNVGLLLERLDAGDWLEQVAAAEESGRDYAIVTRLRPNGIDKQVGTSGAGEAVTVQHGAGTVTQRIGEGAVITERVAARPRLLLFGAGHVGQALAPIAATLPFHLRWFDTRPEFTVPGVTIAQDPVACVAAAPSGAFALIFTQSHALDYELTRAVLARGDFAYCGLIGSATKRARFEKRLLADGISSSALSQLVCPIGEIGLTSKVPQVMAVAIAAELMLVQEKAKAALPVRTQHAV
ncbi:MAG TPA: xanthine dehydrogenase accessory protein XdhC, partial [Rhizomicrobium sp.]|nr:xanthine dehydrogenase accessory protein XdhC [Rhizomicrobium sp.]